MLRIAYSPSSSSARPLRFLSILVAVLVLIAGVLCIVGGHPLNPFKSTAWLTSSSTHMAVWGACPKGPSGFTEYNPEWKLDEGRCLTIFRNPVDFDASANVLYIDFGRRVAVTSLHVLAFAFCALSLILVLTKQFFNTATIFSLASFLFQGVGFSLGTYEFWNIMQKMKNDGDSSATLAPGLYISGGLCIGYILLANLYYAAGRSYSRSEAYKSSV